MSKKIEFLVPGSMWSRRTKSGKENTSTVICISNESLQEAILEMHPQQVVFLTHRKQILTQPIDVYLANRNYVGQDEKMENVYNIGLMGKVDDEADDAAVDAVMEDIDNITLPGEEGLGEEVTGEAFPEDGEEETSIPVFEPALFADVDLDSAFISYSEMPNPHEPGNTMHALRFALDDELTLAKLNTIFDQSRADSLSSIIIDSHVARIELTVTTAWPAFVEIDLTGTAVGIIYLGTQGYVHGEMLANEADDASAKAEIVDAHQVLSQTPQPNVIVNAQGAGVVTKADQVPLTEIPQVQSQPGQALNVGITG